MKFRISRAKKFPENQAKFYAAQVVLALEYIHKLGMVYRDIKPENILLDYKGFVKITDFGFCKVLKDRTYTLCGTPEYLAPEIVQNKGYGQSVDWWSFGVLIYEMAAGYSPFSKGNPDQMEMMERIVAGKFKVPSAFTSDLKDLVQGILQTDLSKRLGNLKNGVADIKNHDWFKSITWDEIYTLKANPPYIPNVSGPGDYSQFDKFDDVTLIVSDIDKYAQEFADF
jgi:protein kinase A